MTITTEATILTIPRNCFRCGGEFRTNSRQRVCPGCRKPKRQRRSGVDRDLTVRELQVVRLVRFGKQNKEVAHSLHLTEGTVKEYLNRIFKKLGVTNRTELAVWAYVNQVAA